MVLPGRIGKAASAAIGAALESRKPDRTVRIDWLDGKQSLVKLPDALFTHLGLAVASRRVEPSPVGADAAQPQGADEEGALPTVADKAFDLVADLVRDRVPARKSRAELVAVDGTAPTEFAEQLRQLASLKEAGILSEDEFSAKKAELLSRL
ncbi:hypothetical protein FM113_17860 [Leucobacter sp. 7(1)]|nr:hypothetical protein FM113_17860 [Leucobacter sp. 7(1)]